MHHLINLDFSYCTSIIEYNENIENRILCKERHNCSRFQIFDNYNIENFLKEESNIKLWFINTAECALSNYSDKISINN